MHIINYCGDLRPRTQRKHPAPNMSVNLAVPLLINIGEIKDVMGLILTLPSCFGLARPHA